MFTRGTRVLTHPHLMIFRGTSKKPFSPSECCGSRDAERHERLPLRSTHRTPLASAHGDGCEQPVAVSGATGRASQFGMARKKGRDWNESPGGAFSPRDVRFCVFHGNMEFAQHILHEVKNSSYDIGATGSWSLKLDILAQSSKVGNLSGQLWVLGLEPLWLFCFKVRNKSRVCEKGTSPGESWATIQGPSPQPCEKRLWPFGHSKYRFCRCKRWIPWSEDRQNGF